MKLQRAGDQMTAAGLSGPTSVGVLANRDCGWVAQANAPWITLTAGASGKGNGTISYMTQSNDADARSALITIGDKYFSVNELGVETTPPPGGSDGGGDSGGGSSGGDSG